MIPVMSVPSDPAPIGPGQRWVICYQPRDRGAFHFRPIDASEHEASRALMCMKKAGLPPDIIGAWVVRVTHTGAADSCFWESAKTPTRPAPCTCGAVRIS